MPNEHVVSYLKENKEKFSKEVLSEQLKQSGYPEVDIVSGIGLVYGSADGVNVSSALPLRYAGFWIRFAASFVDGILLSLAFAPLEFLFIIISADVLVGENVIASVSQALLFWTYSVLMTHYKGATLGKMAFGLRVMSDNGGQASIGKIILRETVGKFVSAAVLLIGYMMAGWTKKKQALHDLIAGTVVVRTR